MSCKVQQSVCSGCVTYAKSRIDFNNFNNFNTFNNVAIETQTKLVGFCLGNKANYNATNYANHIWFDPTNKQILLNGIEYIPKKLSELVNDKNFITSITKSMVENVLTGNITSHTHSQYLPLTGGTLSGDLTCNGYHIDMNNDSGSRGYRGFFNQSNNTNRASGSHIFMKGGGYALGADSVSIGYQAYAGIRNEDADKTTYPYIAWQWMPTEKFMVDTTNSATLSGGEYYVFPLMPNEMVRWSIDEGQKVIYENSSSLKELLVVIKASDADTGLVFGGKTSLPYRASKTLIAGKYIVGSGEYLKKIDEYTINGVKYYQVIIYTWNTTAFPTSYDFTQQVKVMCATKVSNSDYSGASSYASGPSSVASGFSSVASGYYSVASDDFSVVLARNGETMSSYQTIVGKFNAKVAGLFIIGNGTSDTARSNAFVVDDSGNVTAKYFSGYANAVGGEGFKIYPENNNQINFGGTGSDNTVVFGAASKDSRSVPTTYKFGADGKATLLGSADMLDGYHASNLVKFYLSPMSSGAPADSAKSWFINTMPAGTGAIVYNVPGSEKTIIAGKSTGAYGHMLQLNYDDNYLRILRYVQGGWKTTDWEKISAGYADTATALTSSAGSATQPIYFSNGKPVACTYTLAKSVPSNAVFTDTTYSVATASADGLMSSKMFKEKMVKSLGIKQGEKIVNNITGEEIVTDHTIWITNKHSNLSGSVSSIQNKIEIPIATSELNGSMSYTDKRKLDGISSYAPKKVVALRLSFNADATVTVISGGGDYDMTQDAELMGSKYVEQTSTNILYLTTFSLDTTAASTNTLNNLFRNSFVKFSFMGKSTSGISDYSITVKSNFDDDTLEIQFVSTKQDDTWVVDCVWEFF